MPDRRRPAADIARIDERANGIGDAADRQEDERGRRDQREKLVERRDEEPADRQIDADEEPIVAAEEQQLEHDPDDRQSPDPLEQPEAERTVKAGREGRVGTGDQQEDGGVVEIAQQAAAPRRLQHVVEIGKERAEHEADAVDEAGAGAMAGAAGKRENDEADERAAAEGKRRGQDGAVDEARQPDRKRLGHRMIYLSAEAA